MSKPRIADFIGKPINIGCGTRFHPTWLNLDLGASSPHVFAWDSRMGLPVPGASVPFVYSSHMLEHLAPEAAGDLLREIHRVLAPDGILRLVVPDLAKLARWYLESVKDRTEEGFQATWARIHLLDQLVRRESGGRMRHWLATCGEEELALAAERMGSEAVSTRRAASSGVRGLPARVMASLRRPGAIRRGLLKARQLAARVAVRTSLGDRGLEALRVGWFATSGENHLWMYDASSLRHLLELQGFCAVRELDADTSGWPTWQGMNLDREGDGRIYKPDSLYMEGRKPA